jgi:hypothetical protein
MKGETISQVLAKYQKSKPQHKANTTHAPAQ